MPLAVVELTTPENKQLQTYALYQAAIEFGNISCN
jgi:hypothetical protein